MLRGHRRARRVRGGARHHCTRPTLRSPLLAKPPILRAQRLVLLAQHTILLAERARHHLGRVQLPLELKHTLGAAAQLAAAQLAAAHELRRRVHLRLERASRRLVGWHPLR